MKLSKVSELINLRHPREKQKPVKGLHLFATLFHSIDFPDREMALYPILYIQIIFFIYLKLCNKTCHLAFKKK